MSIVVDPVAERLHVEMSKKTGQPAAELLTASSPPSMSSEERFSAMMEIANRAAQLPVIDPRRPDEIIGYNALGFPERSLLIPRLSTPY